MKLEMSSFFKTNKNATSSSASNDIVGKNVNIGDQTFYVNKVIAEGKCVSIFACLLLFMFLFFEKKKNCPHYLLIRLSAPEAVYAGFDLEAGESND